MLTLRWQDAFINIHGRHTLKMMPIAPPILRLEDGSPLILHTCQAARQGRWHDTTPASASYIMIEQMPVPFSRKISWPGAKCLMKAPLATHLRRQADMREADARSAAKIDVQPLFAIFKAIMIDYWTLSRGWLMTSVMPIQEAPRYKAPRLLCRASPRWHSQEIAIFRIYLPHGLGRRHASAAEVSPSPPHIYFDWPSQRIHRQYWSGIQF